MLAGVVEVTGDAAPALGNWNPANDGLRASTGELDPGNGAGDADGEADLTCTGASGAGAGEGASLSLLLVEGAAACGVTGVGGSLRSTDSLCRAADDRVGASTEVRRAGGDDGLGGPGRSTDGRRMPPSLSLPPLKGKCDVDADARRPIPNAAMPPSLSLSGSLLLPPPFGTTRTPPRGSMGLGLVGLTRPSRLGRDTEMEREGVLGSSGASRLPLLLVLLPGVFPL